jgi:hypothetical protein
MLPQGGGVSNAAKDVSWRVFAAQKCGEWPCGAHARVTVGKAMVRGKRLWEMAC